MASTPLSCFRADAYVLATGSGAQMRPASEDQQGTWGPLPGVSRAGLPPPGEVAATWPELVTEDFVLGDRVPARPPPPRVIAALSPLSSQFYISPSVQNSAWISNTRSRHSISTRGHTPLSPQTRRTVVVTGTTTSAVVQIQTFMAKLGDARSYRNVPRGVEPQLRTITTGKPRGTALASLHSTSPSSGSYPICWPSAPHRPLSASTAPSHPNHRRPPLPLSPAMHSPCSRDTCYSRQSTRPCHHVLSWPRPDLPTLPQAHFSAWATAALVHSRQDSLSPT